MQTTYKRVSDLLNMVQDFHEQLAEFYGRLSESSDKERVRMLLEYMSRHEKNFKHAMVEYDEEAANRLLNTWIQYAPDLGVLSVPEAEKLENHMTVDDVVDIAMELDDRLVQFYSEATRLVDSTELKDLFGKLKQQEEADKAEIKKNASYIKDYA